MSPAQIEIMITAIIVSLACGLSGLFLVLRKMSMTSDAISHSILLGIVVAFIITHDLNSPFLIIGAAATGIITVFISEVIQKTKLVNEDSAVGLTFPLLFSLGVILISYFASDVHIDVDSVLLGEIAFIPFDRVNIGNIDIAPKAMITMSIILVLNIAFLLLFFKQLKVSTFDSSFASSIGAKPTLMNYLLMSLVSITAVGAFDSVGSILVIALMVVPVSIGILISGKINIIILVVIISGIFSSIAGYRVAGLYDLSISGSITSILGLVFLLVFMFSPNQGLIYNIFHKKNKKVDFSKNLLLVHIMNHSDSEIEEEENNIDNIHKHLNWTEDYTDKIIEKVIKSKDVNVSGSILKLTESGKKKAIHSMTIIKQIEPDELKNKLITS